MLAVTVEESLNSEGKIKLTIYNKYKTDGTASNTGSQYKLIFNYGADKSKISNTRTENVSSTSEDEDEYIVETKTIETKITTLTWNFDGISTYS